MLCEICGRRKAAFLVEIEGAKLYACAVCAKGGKIIGKLSQKEEKVKSIDKNIEEVVVERTEDIVDDYADRIRKARQRMNIELKDLAKMLNEKESFLKHIERREMIPTIKLAKKLEKVLHIKLVEEVVRTLSTSSGAKKEEFTLADYLQGEEDGG